MSRLNSGERKLCHKLGTMVHSLMNLRCSGSSVDTASLTSGHAHRLISITCLVNRYILSVDDILPRRVCIAELFSDNIFVLLNDSSSVSLNLRMHSSTTSELHMVTGYVRCYLQMVVQKLPSKMEKSSATQTNRDSGPPGEDCLTSLGSVS